MKPKKILSRNVDNITGSTTFDEEGALARFKIRAASDVSAALSPRFAIGDSVKITNPHDPAHSLGEIVLVSAEPVYGVAVAGMESMGMHRWYTDSEMEKEEQSDSEDNTGSKMKYRKTPAAGARPSACEARMKSNKILNRNLSVYGGKTPRSWYSISAKSEDVTEVRIYDEIGFFGVDAATFAQDLQAIKSKTIKLRINSPGGNVFDGVAIYNTIKAHPATVETHIDGLAASIASIIALAGDKIVMAQNAFYMIHQPWLLSIGTSTDLRKDADVLDKIEDMLIDTYATKSTKSRAEIKQMMANETWLSAKESLDAGFIDEIEGDGVEAGFDLSVFRNAPNHLLVQNDDLPTATEFERFLRNAGFSQKESKAIIADGYSAVSQRDVANTQRDVEAVNESIKALIETMRC